jgi:hypothetical protein
MDTNDGLDTAAHQAGQDSSQQDFLSLAAVLRQPHAPNDVMLACARLLQASVGHRLFTILLVSANRADTVRVFSDNHEAYPVNRLKRMGVTPWGDQVIHGRQSYVGYRDADMEWAFPDHALIKSLGLGASLNTPIVYRGECLAVLNLQHEAGRYRPEQVPRVEALAPLLIPAMLELQAALT